MDAHKYVKMLTNTYRTYSRVKEDGTFFKGVLIGIMLCAHNDELNPAIVESLENLKETLRNQICIDEVLEKGEKE